MAFQKPSHTYTKIHLKALRANHFYILLAISFTVLINTFSYAQDGRNQTKSIAPVKQDSTKLKAEQLQDTVKTDTIRKPALLTDIVNHKAKGSESFDRKENKLYLYDEANVKYGAYEITAGVIVIDNNKNIVYAGRIKDSSGVYTQQPIFKQAGDVVESDSIQFNTKTQKALIWNSKTEQQGGTIFPEITKKENDSVYFINNFKFTTAEDTDNPDYYFKGRRAKIVPGKKVITGPTNLYIADVPTPIGVPFAYFPLTNGRTSGIIFPSYGEDNDRGFFIQNGGYYLAINDYADLAVVGDYFTNGSFALRAESNFIKRYKFRSNLRFSFQNLLTSERGFSDFSQQNQFNLNWQHTKDAKSNPNSSFTASVNIGSSAFFRESLNQLNVSSSFNNTLRSSISYSRRFQTVPQVNFSLNASADQNTNTGDINLNLPSFVLNVDRVFPFAPKNGTKKGLFQNINFTYNVNAQNTLQTNEDGFNFGDIFSDAQSVARHTLPISTNFKILKHFSITAGGQYNEVWTLNTINRTFNQDTESFVTDEIRGFDAFRTYNLSASLGTTIYGDFNFGEGKAIEAIRHVIRPSITYSLTPAFDQFFENVQVVDSNGNIIDELDQLFSRFEQIGGPGNTLTSSIGFSINNTLEAKIRSRDSTATEPKKISLLNNLNITGNYNIAADSFNLSVINITGGTKLFDAVNVNFGASFDPYALDSNNNRVDQFLISNGGGLARLTSARLNADYSFSSQNFSRGRQRNEASRQESLRSGGPDDDFFGVSQDFTNNQFSTLSSDNDTNGNNNDDEAEEAELYKYRIPWDLNLRYSITYLNTFGQNEIGTQSLQLSGNVQLSPLWSVGVSSGFDFRNNGITATQFRFERDLKSWRMNFTWVPFGNTTTTWNFFIGVKSSILSDLKFDRRRERDREL